MAELIISAKAKKILSRWCRDEFYVYIRPVTSRFIDVTEKHRIYWSVSVEFRTTQPVQKRGEGYDLSEVIETLGSQVPRRKDIQPGYKGKRPTQKTAGWLMPDSVKVRKTKPKLKTIAGDKTEKSKKTKKRKKA